MSTIVGKPIIENVQQATVSIALQIFARPEEWQGVFDRIEVWRSLLSSAGPFEALTANQWLPAILPNTAGAMPATPVDGKQVVLQGTQLLLRVDGVDDYATTFSESGYITYHQATTDINAQSAGRYSAYVDTDGNVVLQGTRPGTGASLEITGGDAAPLLGLPAISPGNLAYGRDAHIGLHAGVSQYTFIDLNGSHAYFYRARYLNTLTGAIGAFNLPFTLDEASGISLEGLVEGYVALVSAEGRPLFNQLVQVYAAAQTTIVEGKLVTGGRQAKKTDSTGRASFVLIRGINYVVSIAGTDIVRQVLAPTDATVSVVNLLDPSVGTQDDLFTVDRPPLIYAEKRSF